MKPKEKKEKKKFKLFGHKLIIKSQKENIRNESNPIITATCVPHCCQAPYGINITCPKSDFEWLIEAIRRLTGGTA